MTNGEDKRGQSEEDRLLEKAKRYVEKQEREKGDGGRDDKKREHRDRDDDDRHKKSSRRDHGSSSRRDRDKDKDRDRKGRKDRDRDDSRRHRKKRDRSRSRSRSRDRSAGSASASDRKAHRDRSRHDDDDRRHGKKSKKKDGHKKKDRKHGDKKKHSKGDKDEGHRAKPPSPSKLYPLGPTASKPPADPIDAEADYFAYHQHFRLFLYRTKGIHFEDLTSTETHQLFGKFADKYNDGDLEEGYYEAKLPEDALDQCKRTQHKWSFKTNATEQQSLDMVRAGVKKQTEWSIPSDGNVNKGGPGPGPTSAAAASAAGPPQRGRGRKTPEEIQRERAANRRLREHVKTTHEELAGGKADYGRERQLEKKREKANQLHGSHRDREADAMGGPTLGDDDLYGGGRDTSFQQALAREKSRKAKREQKRTERIDEMQKKEDEKAKAMLDMLGLSNIKPGQKIQIAPRKD